jgi:two-component system sensor histidine kinase BaeS
MGRFVHQMRWQIAGAYTLLILLTLGGLSATLYAVTRATYLRTLETEVAGQARLVAVLAERYGPEEASAQLDPFVDDLGRQLRARVTLIDSDGRILADSLLPPERYTDQRDRPEVVAALSGGLGENARYSTATGDDRFYVAVPFSTGGAGRGVARVGVPLATIATAQSQIGLAVLVAALLAAAVAVVLAVLIARRTTRPLRELGAMAGRLAAGHLDVRVPVPPDAEVADLAQSFNQMASRLRQQIDARARAEHARRTLLDNITHDLRTPLASLQALLDALDDGAIDEPDVARDFLGRMGTEVRGLRRLVDEFLELSRIEQGEVTLHRTVTSPLALLESAAGRMAAQARQKGIALSVLPGEQLPQVEVDAGQLEQVLLNLVQNALAATPPGGQITLAAYQLGDIVEISVHDTGVGIAPADLPHIFERFYKADQARSGGGTGLGLAIARHLVERHGGRITATSTPGAGTTLTISLPWTPR